MDMRIQADIIKAADSIRKKLKLLKRGLVDSENISKQKFAPLLKPIETLIDLTSEKRGKKEASTKREPESPLADIIPVKSKVKKKHHHSLVSKDSSVQTGDESDEGEKTPLYRTEIYETPEAAEVAWEHWTQDSQHYGPLSKEYLDALVLDTKDRFDFKFGVREDPKSKKWFMGNKEIAFDNEDYVHIDNKMFRGTRGLFELLFKKLPDSGVITERDKEVYKSILELTSAHYQLFNPNLRIASSSGLKYNSFVKELFKKGTSTPKRTGSNLIPVTNNKIDYVHWNDPNELVERLLLLKSSQAAGNSGHLMEIASIEEELREANYIE